MIDSIPDINTFDDVLEIDCLEIFRLLTCNMKDIIKEAKHFYYDSIVTAIADYDSINILKMYWCNIILKSNISMTNDGWVVEVMN